ncbi:transglutaminaseTgpA domain-containing protein [Streptomyces sp. NPDC101118]|uniref:transglutaminase family protein n=1 Tax=Streptomyces sp. NPDC101118 TaxID=3366109 RepID=UPI00382BAA22
MSGRARLTLCALLATLLTACAMLPLVHPATWLPQAAVLLALQSATGAGARRVPLARWLTVLAQLVVSVVLLTLLFVGERALGGVLPGPGALRDFGALFSQGVQDVGHYAMPAPLTDGIRLLLLSGVLLIGLMVDALAVTFRTAAAAGLPLLALYSVAAGLSQGGSDWLWFLLAGCGYLLLLLAEGRDRLSQWGRVFGGAPRKDRGTAAGLTGGGAVAPVRTGRRLGALALGIALVVPLGLPALEGGLLGGTGSGDGEGLGGTISAVNPLVSLQNSLNVTEDREVLRYRTDHRNPSDQYLRIVALDEFDGQSWKTAERHITDVPERLPDPPGLSPAVRTTEVRTSVSAAGWYAQTYLPMPYPATQVDIGGKWRFEPVGRTLVGDRGQNTRGVQYTVRGLRLQPTAEQLTKAPQPAPALVAEYTRVPAGLPPAVEETALRVTRKAKSDYERAVLLQDWFASAGGFTYDTHVNSGTGTAGIAKFLEDKRGFCVHFSFTMAAMARTLRIPARVAVGFTAGSAKSDGSWSVTLRDAHAWPELYFEGVGWTRFEPTPSRGSTPDYTRPETPTGRPSNPAPEVPGRTAAPAPAPSSSASDACPPEMRRLGECGQAQAGAGADDDGPTWGQVALLSGAALLMLAIPVLPVLWRSRVRRRRLASGDPLEAWRELGDAAWDVGVEPDGALSPRGAARRIVALGRLDGEAEQGVLRLAGAVERSLYAPPAAGPGDAGAAGAAEDVLRARAALLAGVGRWSRLRALVAPRSAVRVRWAVSDRWVRVRGAVAGRLRTVRIPLRGRG